MKKYIYTGTEEQLIEEGFVKHYSDEYFDFDSCKMIPRKLKSYQFCHRIYIDLDNSVSFFFR